MSDKRQKLSEAGGWVNFYAKGEVQLDGDFKVQDLKIVLELLEEGYTDDD